MQHELIIDISTQQLSHLIAGQCRKIYSISSGLNGVGEQRGSGQTPRGWHIIRAKIGTHQSINTIFVGRRPAGLYSETIEQEKPDQDWILTRILWLSGTEVGHNRLGECDTMRRYIYIHGCPDSKPMGMPLSKGCIRMRNQDILELFDAVPAGTKVFIKA